MKKIFFVIALQIAFVAAIFSQELLLNPGFETSKQSIFFGVEFEDWTMQSVNAVETTDKVEGNQALKIVEADKATNKIEQQIFDYAHKPEVGATYVLRIKYKVLTSKEGNDVKISSFWSTTRDNESDHDANVLKTDFFTASEWSEKVVETTCPEAGNAFFFRVEVGKGVVALFDDFSFTKKSATPDTGGDKPGENEGGNEGGDNPGDNPGGEGGNEGGDVTGTPVLYVEQISIPVIYGEVGKTYDYPVLNIVHKNLKSDVIGDIRGANRDQFSFELKEKNDTTIEMHITYKPTKAGRHKGMLVIESAKHPELSITAPFEAYSIDAANPPVITVKPTVIPIFDAEAKTDSVYKIRLKSERCIQLVSAKMKHIEKAGFIVQSSAFAYNMELDVEVVFSPKVAGNYKSELSFYTYGADTVKVMLTGRATPSKINPEEFDAEFNWDMSKPMKLFQENFDTCVHNQGLKYEGWQNVVKKGTRGWWGFEHTDAEGIVTDRSAKATGYEYQVPSEGNRAEMWLVTPALDYKNAENKVFTLRVMGDFMFKDHDTRMSVYLIDSIPGDTMIVSEIQGLVPTSPDLNGEWNEYHLNLGEYEIADVFWIAFKYEGLKGQENSVVYYVDDLSWGRTDLPQITPDSVKVEMYADLNQEKQSGKITVKTSNLVNDITMKLDGPNKSKFKLTKESLPKEGGSFYVLFNGEEEGVHQAYVKLSSRGAADVYIPIAVLCKHATDVDMVVTHSAVWVEDRMINVTSDIMEQVCIYSIDGKLVTSLEADSEEMRINVPNIGAYIVKVKTQEGMDVHKLMVK